VYVQLGIMYFKRGRYPLADVELKRAIELDTENGAAYFYRGESLNHLQRVDEAIEMLGKAVKLQPGNGRAYYTMGLLYDRKNLRDEAQLMFRKAREVAAT
jgi:tetratricopeptide (TPR) repeat protein